MWNRRIFRDKIPHFVSRFLISIIDLNAVMRLHDVCGISGKRTTMIENLTGVDLAVLYDVLASNTANYTQMLSQGVVGDEFDQCKQNILRIQAEIDRREVEKRFIVQASDIDFINQNYH